MDEHDVAGRILAFAKHCGNAGTAPEDTARDRGWLDGAGAPTQEGHDLLRALDDQDETRSVFRTVL